MLKKLLRFDPSDRMTASEALEHPYLEELHTLYDEASLDDEHAILSPFDFDFE